MLKQVGAPETTTTTADEPNLVPLAAPNLPAIVLPPLPAPKRPHRLRWAIPLVGFLAAAGGGAYWWSHSGTGLPPGIVWSNGWLSRIPLVDQRLAP